MEKKGKAISLYEKKKGKRCDILYSVIGMFIMDVWSKKNYEKEKILFEDHKKD